MSLRSALRLTAAGGGFGAALAIVAALALGGGVQQERAVARQAPEGASEREQLATATDEKRGDTIRVHGHWTIEVRSAAGERVSYVEFDNALGPFASSSLTGILARTSSVGRWTIAAGPGPCIAAGSCFIVEPEDPITPTPPGVFKTLSVSKPKTGANADKLVLSGTATALQDGAVDQVATGFVICVADVAPATPCASTALGAQNFTLKLLLAPTQVSAGQQILVTVVISFQ